MGTIAFTGSATGVDANTGAAVTAAVTPSNVDTIGQGGLSALLATFHARLRTAVSVGQVFSLRSRVGKTGAAAANVTAITVTGATAPPSRVTGVTNGQAIPVPGCTATASGTLSATATVA